jgi:hypothetical protein
LPIGLKILVTALTRSNAFLWCWGF